MRHETRMLSRHSLERVLDASRPFVTNTNLVLADPEDSFGYPSGHSTRATVYALPSPKFFPASAM
ncbi:MAG TPA: hypothetical protein VHG89_05415 [Verrucomicrobiae bacterium]|nr:hypothetical protein [Verrucomicrobiae bacterium]